MARTAGSRNIARPRRRASPPVVLTAGERGELEESERFYEKAAYLQQPGAYYGWARVLRKLGREDEAEKWRDNSSHQFALMSLATIAAPAFVGIQGATQ